MNLVKARQMLNLSDYVMVEKHQSVGCSACPLVLTWRNGYPEFIPQTEKGGKPMAKTKKGGKKKPC